MKLLEILAKEMEQEAVTTRKMLSRIPNDKFDWQPHELSMTIERLSNHIAELPGWVDMILNTPELDFENNPYQATTYDNTDDLLEFFEAKLQDGLNALKEAQEVELEGEWTLRRGDVILQRSNKLEFIRHTFCQIVHHRAQMGVYLRLLDVPIPGSYGPSGDEMRARAAAVAS